VILFIDSYFINLTLVFPAVLPQGIPAGSEDLGHCSPKGKIPRSKQISNPSKYGGSKEKK
jgi:hypothetical protein